MRYRSYLEFSKSKRLAQTGARTVHKGEYVSMSLDILSKAGVELIIQPAFRLKVLSVWAPENFRPVDEAYRDADNAAFGNGDSGNGLAGAGDDRRGEREEVVLISLKDMVFTTNT